jgi:hypothetical protein
VRKFNDTAVWLNQNFDKFLLKTNKGVSVDQ